MSHIIYRRGIAWHEDNCAIVCNYLETHCLKRVRERQHSRCGGWENVRSAWGDLTHTCPEKISARSADARKVDRACAFACHAVRNQIIRTGERHKARHTYPCHL